MKKLQKLKYWCFLFLVLLAGCSEASYGYYLESLDTYLNFTLNPAYSIVSEGDKITLAKRACELKYSGYSNQDTFNELVYIAGNYNLSQQQKEDLAKAVIIETSIHICR